MRTDTPRALVIAFVVGAIAGAAVLRSLLGSPAPEIRYRTAFLPESVLVQGEPDTVVRLVERIEYRQAPPERVAVAPQAARPDVATFCGAAGWTPQPIEPAAGVDSAPPGQPTGPPIPRALLLRSFDYDDGDLTLWGPRSDGALWRGDYRVGSRFRGTVSGDSVFVQVDRFGHWRQFGERALMVGAGAALGYVVAQF